MYFKQLFLTVALGFPLATFSQDVKQEEALQKMIESEKAFAQTSIDKGTKNAFLSFLGKDAIVFEKGMPVNGLEKWQNQDFQQVLTWQPNFAEISGAADLGYTAGNWQIHDKTADGKAFGFGTFVTLWKKQSDDTWKVAVDIGVGHADNASKSTQIIKNYPVFKPADLKNPATLAERFVFMQDHFFWKNAKTALNPFEPHLSQNVRIYRNSQLPIVGKDPAGAFLKKSYDKKLIYTGLKAIASASGDLVCVYGTVSGKGSSGSYLRMWRQEAKGVWKITLEIVSI
ncbi:MULTISPECIES: DUF4440 domain-containing protein [unclassified Arcicella]|uniref:YybH family protein n=1 Tax=unclassified Arcicella TaxID=2644986 RepID=UPI0028578C83|nr:MULTISPECIES: DUF4440 domain-containing protein [unclassified Arcicella]MDR6564164.1 ketosteroid isomerase-like protein [Arcicella sp. BE51]MDR6813917.1 ketosteroid isomerase-like protein [Arcicella sp. BE140]MDR6825229.1 ketosteroid isomerase-like protein [Arcicella sp. BE139]